MTEFLDLDNDNEDLLAENTAFRKALDWLASKNDPFRLIVGVWICTGKLNHAQASNMLLYLDCYKEVPGKNRGAYLPLALYLTEYFHKHPGHLLDAMPATDTFLYHTMMVMRTIQMFYTTDEQHIIMEKIMEKITRSRG